MEAAQKSHKLSSALQKLSVTFCFTKATHLPPIPVSFPRPPSLAQAVRGSRVSDAFLSGAPRDPLTKKQGCICWDTTSKPNISEHSYTTCGSTGQSSWSTNSKKHFRFDAGNQPLEHDATTSLYSHINQHSVQHALQSVCPQLQNSSQTHTLHGNTVWVKRQRYQTARWVIHKSHLDS